ncbi:hypothetical protein [Epilithonimonas sp. UC225_85]|uniref:hypothetical protein n=1 Tax=Epilithonimonas sp. UC225_85 TaxID=3350167 RepID=UPI0036D2846D
MFSCTNQSKVLSSSKNEDTIGQPKPKIVYLFFEAEKSADGKVIVQLIDKKVSDGFFKNEDFGTAKEITNSYYKIMLFDKNDQVFKTSIIDNPLSPIFESYSENSMEKQIGKLSKAEFFYRYNDSGNISKLEIHKTDNGKSDRIFTLKL